MAFILHSCQIGLDNKCYKEHKSVIGNIVTNMLQLDSTLPQVLIFFIQAGDAFRVCVWVCARYIMVIYSSSCYYIGLDLHSKLKL